MATPPFMDCVGPKLDLQIPHWLRGPLWSWTFGISAKTHVAARKTKAETRASLKDMFKVDVKRNICVMGTSLLKCDEV